MRPRNQAVMSLLKSGSQTCRIDAGFDGPLFQVAVNDAPRIRASWQLIGKRHPQQHRWRWSWADSQVDAQLTKDAVLTRRFGEEHVIYELITAELPDDDNLPFELTFVAAMLSSGDAVWPLVQEGRPTEFLVLHDTVDLSVASA
jgi:hypothetical protein